MKYKVYIEKWMEPTQLEYSALGAIKKKPELYYIHLKWWLGTWKGVIEGGMAFIMDSISKVKNTIIEEGKMML
jgi:hypothetical protein